LNLEDIPYFLEINAEPRRRGTLFSYFFCSPFRGFRIRHAEFPCKFEESSFCLSKHKNCVKIRDVPILYIGSIGISDTLYRKSIGIRYFPDTKKNFFCRYRYYRYRYFFPIPYKIFFHLKEKIFNNN